MNFDLKLGKAAAVLFLALAMVGCGGGGGTTTGPVEPPPPTAEDERMAVDTAVKKAQMAVADLTGMSTDEEVGAAADAIAAAKTALSGVKLLSASEVLAFQGSIDGAEAGLGTARTTISNYRTHQMQYSDAMDAVNDATTAVAGLSAMSSDADVNAAQQAINDAKEAVTAGTMLTDAEVGMLNGQIETAETDLGTARTTIADYREHNTQYANAMKAADAATTAVGALTPMSSNEDADAAQGLIDDAETALMAGTTLTDAEVTALKGQIAIAKVNLGTARLAMSGYRTHQLQYNTAMNAVNAAKTAVMGLTADSTDEEVTEAENAITAAKNAITDGTTLTEGEVAMLSGQIGTAETDLGTVKGQIALRKERDAAQVLARLHGEASGATADATAAGKMADKALEDAEKYSGMLGVLDVGGSSVMARNNAQMVLGARTNARTAAQNAATAKTRAQTAKTEATGLPNGDAKDKLISALDGAIDVADAEIKATMEIRDAKASVADSLASFVQIVEGTDEDNLMDADDIGMGVANLINTALTTDAQTPAVGTDFAAVQTVIDDTDDLTGKVTMGPSDARGKTFAELYASMVMDMRIGTTGGGTRAVKAKSVAGMTLDDLFSTTPTSALTTTDGFQIETDVAYKGISGVLFCAGECDVEAADATATAPADDDELTGDWYFTDLNANNRYLAGTGTAAGTYTLEAVTSYVRYGYWLSTASATDDTTTISRYAVGPAAQTDTVYGVSTTVDNFKGTSAMYTGKALGMSVVKTFDSAAEEQSRASGGFTADARLTMKFGTNPMLGGTISNFMGDGVDTGWTVKLEDSAITSGAVSGITNDAPATDTEGTAREGTWTATIWGGSATADEEARPTGAYGGFDAEFTNGNVVGVYATRKQ